jgi:hypothetical protein
MAQATEGVHHAPASKQPPSPPRFTAGGICYVGVYRPDGVLTFVPSGSPAQPAVDSSADTDERAIVFEPTLGETVRIRATVSRALDLLRARHGDAS